MGQVRTRYLKLQALREKVEVKAPAQLARLGKDGKQSVFCRQTAIWGHESGWSEMAQLASGHQPCLLAGSA